MRASFDVPAIRGLFWNKPRIVPEQSAGCSVVFTSAIDVHKLVCMLPIRELFHSNLRIVPYPLCAAAFPSSKALAQHERVKHGLRDVVRCYVSNGVCLVCRKDFGTRLRCLSHLKGRRNLVCQSA